MCFIGAAAGVIPLQGFAGSCSTHPAETGAKRRGPNSLREMKVEGSSRGGANAVAHC